jgi:hypothetical protein
MDTGSEVVNRMNEDVSSLPRRMDIASEVVHIIYNGADWLPGRV